VLEEDAPDLLDRLGVALDRVLRADDQLRFLALIALASLFVGISAWRFRRQLS
jgi:hypothetical protein